MDPRKLDLGYLSLFAGYAYADAVQRRLPRDLRFSHGFVFQHLVDGGRTMTDLAARMEITVQGASKAVKELVALGYVEIDVDTAADARVHTVRLSRRGAAAVASARRERRRLEKKLERVVGARKLARARAVLADVLDALGGVDAVKNRRVRGPS